MNTAEIRAKALECASRMSENALRDDRAEMRKWRVDWVLEAAQRFEVYIQTGRTERQR